MFIFVLMKNWIQTAVALVLLMAAIACNKNSESDLPDTSGGITVYQMIPNYTASFDFVLDTTTIGSNLGYGQSSGAYKQFRAQNYKLFIYPAGNRADTLAVRDVSIRNKHDLSVFLFTDSANLANIIITDDDLSLPSTVSPRAKIRVVDLADTWVRPTGSTNRQPLALDVFINYVNKQTPPVFRGVAFGAVTPSVEILAQEKPLNFNWRDSSYTMQTVQLNALEGKIYTLVATVGARKPLTDTSFRLWQFTNN